MYWGRLIGCIAGSVWGPIGSLVGFYCGYIFDTGFKNVTKFQNITRDMQQTFFIVTFQVMGCIAKSDGHISLEEIRLAKKIMMHTFHLSKNQMYSAIEYFNEGKKADFNLSATINYFYLNCISNRNLVIEFLEIQIKMALVDGSLHSNKEKILRFLCKKLNINDATFNFLYHAQITSKTSYGYHARKDKKPFEELSQCKLDNAYRTLGVTNFSSLEEIKKSYRRLISQHHPDKLIAKSCSAEVINTAKQKTQKISSAYALIIKQRKN